MNKMFLVVLLVLIAVVLLLAMLALGYSQNWGVSGEATSTPTSEFPTLGVVLTRTPGPTFTPTPTPNLAVPATPNWTFPTRTPLPIFPSETPTGGIKCDLRPCPTRTPTLWHWPMATPTH